jgi:lactoylglutathione lyase
MINRFGKVMVYVQNPRLIANFWVEKIGFTEIVVNQHERGILSIELATSAASDAKMVLFDKSIVAEMSPEIHLGTPSILFSSDNVKEMREELIMSGVTVGEIMEMEHSLTFNFSDPEGNFFAVEEILKSSL